MSFTDQVPFVADDASEWTGLVAPATVRVGLNDVAGRVKSLEAGAGTGGFAFVRKLVAESVTSSTALQDDNELFFPIGANETWEARFVVLLTGGSSAGDFSCAFSAPSGAVGSHSQVAAASGGTGNTDTNLTSYSGSVFTDSFTHGSGINSTGSVVIAAYFDVMVVNGSTPGNVVLRWAQLASNATATTVAAHSYVKAIRTFPIQPAGGNMGSMQLVSRQIITGSAAASVTFTGLDLSTDCHYILEWSVQNAIASAKTLYAQLNGDTTATNYRQAIHDWAGTAQVLQNNNTPGIGVVALSNFANGVFEIFKPATGGITKGLFRTHYGTTAVPEIMHGGWLWNNTANPTQLVITPSDGTAAFAVGSEFRLYRCSPTPVRDDGFREVVAQVDQDVASNTTVANDNELFFTMEAGAKYEWEVKFWYSSPVGGATPDCKIAFNGPATLTGQQDVLLWTTTADSLTSSPGQGALTTASPIGTATTPRLFYARGYVYSTAGGVGSAGFIVQWAQNTSSVNVTRRHSGSILRWKKY